MLDLAPFLAAFMAGLLVKAVDWLDDERKSRNPIKYVMGAAYGILIGYLIGTASFSVLFLAALAGQVFARKIDTLAHIIGFIVSALAVMFFGFPALDLGLFAFFLALAFLDEIDYVGSLRPLTDWRPFLKIGALVPLLWGRWDYLAGILAFDIGYVLVPVLHKFSQKFVRIVMRTPQRSKLQYNQKVVKRPKQGSRK